MFVSLVFFGCTTKEKPKTIENYSISEWTEESKRCYFQDSIANRMYNGSWGTGDSLNNFDCFIKTLYPEIKSINKTDAFVYAFEEPYIDSVNYDSDKNWFRITVDPCFRIPYCIIIEKKYNKTYLTSKVTNGHGGYFSGELLFSLTEIYTDSLYEEVSERLHEVDFWNLKKDTTCIGGFDGENWTFEAIEDGKYNIIDRWVPLHCGDSTTRKLGNLGTMLIKKSNMVELLELKTNISKENLENGYFE